MNSFDYIAASFASLKEPQLLSGLDFPLWVRGDNTLHYPKGNYDLDRGRSCHCGFNDFESMFSDIVSVGYQSNLWSPCMKDAMIDGFSTGRKVKFLNVDELIGEANAISEISTERIDSFDELLAAVKRVAKFVLDLPLATSLLVPRAFGSPFEISETAIMLTGLFTGRFLIETRQYLSLPAPVADVLKENKVTLLRFQTSNRSLMEDRRSTQLTKFWSSQFPSVPLDSETLDAMAGELVEVFALEAFLAVQTFNWLLFNSGGLHFEPLVLVSEELLSKLEKFQITTDTVFVLPEETAPEEVLSFKALFKLHNERFSDSGRYLRSHEQLVTDLIMPAYQSFTKLK